MMKKLLGLGLATVIGMSGTAVFAEDELILNTAYSGFSARGSWDSASLVGYNGEYILSAEAGDNVSAQWDITTSGGEYRIYIWHCLKDNGSDDAVIEVSTLSGTYKKECSMAYGVSGWFDLGVYDLLDGSANIKITGKTGTIMASAVKLVPWENKNDETDAGDSSGITITLHTEEDTAYVNGKEYAAGVSVFPEGVYVPLRFCAEQLGYTVEWDDTEKKTVLTKDDNIMTLLFKSSDVVLNSESLQTQNPSKIVGGLTMVSPEIFEMLGCDVNFFDNSVTIKE